MKRLILLFEHKMSIVSLTLPPRTKNSVDSFPMYGMYHIRSRVLGVCMYVFGTHAKTDRKSDRENSPFFIVNISNIVCLCIAPQEKREETEAK